MGLAGTWPMIPSLSFFKCIRKRACLLCVIRTAPHLLIGSCAHGHARRSNFIRCIPVAYIRGPVRAFSSSSTFLSSAALSRQMSAKTSADRKPQDKKIMVRDLNLHSAPTRKALRFQPFLELSSGRGGSGNIRRVKSTKEMGSRPLASPRMLELEPPRNRVRMFHHRMNCLIWNSPLLQAAYGGRGGSGNVWTHVIEEGVFDRVLNYEISRARVLKEERAHEKAERRRSGGTAAAATAIRARSQSDAKPASAASADCG